MSNFIYILIGIAGTGVVLLLSKLFGGKKGDKFLAKDTKRASDALQAATDLLGERAVAEAKDEEDRARVKEVLNIEDPVERLEAIADELKDL